MVRPQVEKTTAIAACPQPKTKKEVRQFLGLASFYRRFIPNFADLISLLKDGPVDRSGPIFTLKLSQKCPSYKNKIVFAHSWGPDMMRWRVRL